MKNKFNLSQGFSLVELMVSLVAGLIVIGAVGAFTISSLQSNAEYIQATRLTQELRSTMDFTSRELRRAGYNEDAFNNLLKTVVTPSPFDPIFVPGTYTNNGASTNTRTSNNRSCIIYAYDRSGTPASRGSIQLAKGEIRGIRRSVVAGVGVIEFAESASGLTPACDAAGPTDYATNYPATCNATTGWCALSDPRQIDITSFSLSVTSTPNILSSSNNLLIRQIDVSIQGALPGQPDVVRGIQSSIKIRSDCIRSTVAACESIPAGT